MNLRDEVLGALVDPAIVFVENEEHAGDYWQRQMERLHRLAAERGPIVIMGDGAVGRAEELTCPECGRFLSCNCSVDGTQDDWNVYRVVTEDDDA